MEAVSFLPSSCSESSQQAAGREIPESLHLHYLLINEASSLMGPSNFLPNGNRDAEGEIQAIGIGNEFFSPLTMQKLPFLRADYKGVYDVG